MKAVKNKSITTNLLWTGGWDSTFRLLQLLLLEKKPVQPYYILFKSRKSAQKEIDVMNEIRQLLFKKFPGTKKLLHPTKYISEENIKPDNSLQNFYKTIRSKDYIGGQYVTLATFRKQHGFKNLELCVELGDKSDDNLLKPFVKKSDKYNNDAYRIDPDAPEPIYQLFREFRFPLKNYSKLEMLKIAHENEWYSIMERTWFCHHPIFSRIPCGVCNPCRDTIKFGMKWRIPVVVRLSGKTVKNIYNSKLVYRIRSILN